MQSFDTSHLTKEIFLFYNHCHLIPYIKIVNFYNIKWGLGVPCLLLLLLFFTLFFFRSILQIYLPFFFTIVFPPLYEEEEKEK